MIDYALAKKLKDAGFFAKGNECCPCGNYKMDLDGYCGHGLEDAVYRPNLSELIGACGDKFAALMRMPGGDMSFPYWIVCHAWTNEKGKGSTAEEAVANFWIELNKKL